MGGPWSHLERCLLIMVAASSWVDEFIQCYETQGLGMWDELDSDSAPADLLRMDGSLSIGPLICGVTLALFTALLLWCIR